MNEIITYINFFHFTKYNSNYNIKTLKKKLKRGELS